jgi:hypothetical protein
MLRLFEPDVLGAGVTCAYDPTGTLVVSRTCSKGGCFVTGDVDLDVCLDVVMTNPCAGDAGTPPSAK